MINNGKYAILIILVTFYLIIRLSILTGSIGRLHFEDEMYRGNIAKELISGPILPFFDYQRSEFEGGSLVIGVLAVPFFLLFKETLFSLKLAALSFSVFIFITWYLFLDKFFHRRVAILTGLLWIFSPPFFTQANLCITAYSETNFFTILAIFIFYQIFYIKEKKSLFAILGLINGFAVFFNYAFLATLLVILLFWFIFDKKFIFSRNFLIFSLFFLLGFSPWIYYNLTHNFEGFMAKGKPLIYWFTPNSLLVSLIRFKDMATTKIVNNLGFQNIDFIDHRLFASVSYFIFVFSFCGLLFINRKAILKIAWGVIPHRRFALKTKEISPEILLISFPIIFLIILSVTNFNFYSDFDDFSFAYVYQYRYLLIIFPFIFSSTAIFYHRIFGTRKPVFVSHFSLCLILILLIFGLIRNFNLVLIGNFEKDFMYKIYRGYNYYDLGKLICWRYSDPERSVGLIKGIKRGDDRRYCYAGMGWGFGKEKFNSDYSLYIRYVLPKIDKQYWPNACERMGRVIGYNKDIVAELKNSLDANYLPYFYRGVGVREARRFLYDFKSYARLVNSIDEEYRPYLHEGIGMELDEAWINDTEGFIQFTNAIDHKYRPYIYKELARGREYYQINYSKFGYGIGRIGYSIGRWNEIINKIAEEFRPYCYQRLGIEIGWRFLYDIKKYLNFLVQIDERYSPHFYKGMGMAVGLRFGYDLHGCLQLIKEVNQKYWPFLFEGLGIGVTRRYNYQLDEWSRDAEKIPSDYKSYFQIGVKETVDNRLLGLQ